MNHKVKIPLFRPFRHRLFRRLCLANFLANIGSWMQIFATGWLVASQAKDPAIAAMAQTLTQIPVFLFSVLGGVMADRLNTYSYLGGVNLGMFFSATALAVLCLVSTPEVSVIFLFTFITATGTALKASAWQASMSSMVDREEIEAAATLNGLSYNLASVIGPGLGSMLFVVAGPSFLYFTNALCLLGLVIIYLFARTRYSAQSGKRPGYLSLLSEGFKVSAGSSQFRNILLTTAVLFFSVSTFQALLPAYVSLVLKGDSDTLGLLMGGFGTGAVLSAFALPTLRSLFARHHILALASLVYGLLLFAFSASLPVHFLLPAATIGGFSWSAIVSTMNSAAQLVFSSVVRARALSIYSMCFYGALTVGSLTWGKVSSHYGITSAFLTAGGLMILTAFYIFIRRKIAEDEHKDNVSAPLTEE